MDSGILSANPEFEKHILGDRNFLFSHLATNFTRSTTDEITGQMIDPYLIGKQLFMYENIAYPTQGLITTVMQALDNLIANPDLLQNRKTLQTVLKVDDFQQPLLGFSAIVALNQLATRAADSNTLTEFLFEVDDYDQVIKVPSYISCMPYDFFVNMTDYPMAFNNDGDTESELVCLALDFQAKTLPEWDLSFNKSGISSTWAYKLTHHYEQAQYKLSKACQMAESRPYAFALICAAILGVPLDKLSAYKQAEAYERLSADQRYDYLETIKPLIEKISFDFISDDLISI